MPPQNYQPRPNQANKTVKGEIPEEDIPTPSKRDSELTGINIGCLAVLLGLALFWVLVGVALVVLSFRWVV